ncbi:glycosyltransferase family 2 protein [Subsaxibacter sp. CAU 1640]|uniref:glycosyltransferase family 2 protein n=1 Tax=Subsaxibacter sp. CAU 1640 TaxID=2933271 RepID=UPI0020057BF8|nr:glycosyltransferase family A protein [Subsaxibacter sp. CAU 1640]MCK7591509.1 glycosyltransferase family 2 protein [Subsaxibacter sp. CAU 1640]
MTFFSVVIPLYNKEKHIKNTLESVLNQTFHDYEVIVINDGSTDESGTKARQVLDNRIKIVDIQNKGVSNARNFGTALAKGRFIAFLDADDEWKPNHLENLKNIYDQYPDCGLYAAAYEHRSKGYIIPSIFNKIPTTKGWLGKVDDFFESSTINCIASASSAMIPKDIFDRMKGFDTLYNSGEDIDLWIRIALNYDVSFNSEVSVIIEMDADNQVSKSSVNERNHLNFDKFKNEEINNRSLKKYLDLNRFAMAIQHRLEGNRKQFRDLRDSIDKQNLNVKQQLLLKMSPLILNRLLKLKKTLRSKGFELSSFR